MDFETVTLACNNRCVFCSQRGLDQIPERAPDGSADAVVFAGGEPTVAEDLPARIRAARADGVARILLQTNGRRLAYAAYLEELIEAGLTHLEISLHGADPTVHDYHTRIEGSFKQTARGVMLATRSPLTVAVTTVVTRSNFRHLAAIARLLRKLGVQAWMISAARPLGAAEDEHSSVPPRLGMLPDYLGAALRDAKGIEVTFSGIPPCVVPSARVVAFRSVDPRGLAHSETCATCQVRSACGGPAVGYSLTAAATDLTPFAEPVALRTPNAWYAGMGVVRG